jgi:cytochrome c oxidase subunit 2
MTWIVLLVIALGVYAFIQLAAVMQLTTSLKGNEEEVVTEKDNRINAKLMFLFGVFLFGFFIWQVNEYSKDLHPESASEHGKLTDALWDVNIYIITIVFFVVNAVLFFFASKYYFRKGNKATFFAHSTKLEMAWTIVPAVVLAGIIIYGLKTWNGITTPLENKDAYAVIELYAKQFDWTARYAGTDKQLGSTNYKLITDENPLAVDRTDKSGDDDVIVKGEFHIPVGKPILFKFRSRDIIHSAYFPHFRAQMNCVPGMETQFHFVPTITTAEMRQKLHNDKFDYVLLCNKICGSSHFNMQMNVIVDSEADYNKWLASQKTIKQKEDEAKQPTAVQPEVAKTDSVKVMAVK